MKMAIVAPAVSAIPSNAAGEEVHFAHAAHIWRQSRTTGQPYRSNGDVLAETRASQKATRLRWGRLIWWSSR
jgi:hypothetical protein